MSHDLMQKEDGSYAFASWRQPVWHRLGQVFEKSMSACEAWKLLDEPYDVMPMRMLWPDESESDIYGLAKIDKFGEIEKSFGYVSQSYTCISPRQFCEAWDRAGELIGKDKFNVETIGALGDGSRFFLLSRLPDATIVGEEYQNYLLGVNNMDGKTANYLKVTPVRVVCANTMSMALKDFDSVYKVDHDTELVSSTISWLHDVFVTTEQKIEAVKEALELFAKKPMNDDLVESALKVALPIPKQPRKTGSPLYDSKLQDQYDAKSSLIVARRNVINSLYQGEMMGYDTIATHGTAYGLYCATTEAMDHVIPGRGESNTSYADGWRDTVKSKIFSHLLEVSKN